MTELLKYFLRLLAKKDYSERELCQKARTQNYQEEDISETIIYLKKKKYIDDERLAENLVQHYQGEKGQNWLAQKMKQRLIPDEVINQVLSLNQDHINEINPKMKDFLAKKYKILDWQNLDYNTKNKVIGFLVRRGFKDPFQIFEI